MPMPLLNIPDPLNILRPAKNNKTELNKTEPGQNQATDSTPNKIDTNKIDIDYAIDRTADIIRQIDITRAKINDAISSIKEDNIKKALDTIEEAYKAIECNKCKGKFIVSQAKLQVAQLTCELGDSSCDTAKQDVVRELEYLRDEYLSKVELFNINKIKNAVRQTISL